jgi:hypothetical protein
MLQFAFGRIRSSYRLLALLLLLGLVFTPVCSSLCQTRNCHEAQAGTEPSDCRHARMPAPGAADLSARSAACDLSEMAALLDGRKLAPSGGQSLKLRSAGAMLPKHRRAKASLVLRLILFPLPAGSSSASDQI